MSAIALLWPRFQRKEKAAALVTRAFEASNRSEEANSAIDQLTAAQAIYTDVGQTKESGDLEKLKSGLEADHTLHLALEASQIEAVAVAVQGCRAAYGGVSLLRAKGLKKWIARASELLEQITKQSTVQYT